MAPINLECLELLCDSLANIMHRRIILLIYGYGRSLHRAPSEWICGFHSWASLTTPSQQDSDFH